MHSAFQSPRESFVEPCAQAEQVPALVVPQPVRYSPASHASQASQAAQPAVSEYAPVAQSLQCRLLVLGTATSPYLPAAHSVQSLSHVWAAFLNDECAHVSHVPALVPPQPLRNLPASQVPQAVHAVHPQPEL